MQNARSVSSAVLIFHELDREAYEGRLCARHSSESQGGDVSPSSPGGQPRPDRRPGPLQGEACGRRPLSVRLGSGGRDDPGAGSVPSRECRHANAVVLDADQPHYRRVFGQVLASLQGISDRVEGAELGTAYVRLDGLEGLYRGEARVVSALLNAVPAYLTPRIGVADAKFPALVAARTCTAHGAFRVPDDARAFLAPHTIDLLSVSVDVRSEMHRFGLHTMGAVASMSRHMLTDRFGSEGGACLGALQWNRRQPRHPPGVPGVGGRARLAAIPFLLRRGPIRGGRRSPQEGLCPTGHERPLRRVGRASLCGVRLAVLGEEHQVQAASRLVGEGLPSRPKQVGS